MSKIYVFQGDYDYAPVAIISDERGLIFEGDNEHNRGYEKYAAGYADALGHTVVSITLRNLKDLEVYKQMLETKAEDMYKEFKNDFEEFEDEDKEEA